ncbi:trypsin-like peptidase domain-containing protein [Desulfobulbus propionicus]|jgi:S1-C subfamily serine protease
MPTQITCPKCGHEQTNPVECESCGLLFRKYAQVQERTRQQEAAKAASRAKKQSRLPALIGSALLLMAMTAGTTVYLMRGPQAPPVSPPAKEPMAATGQSAPQPSTASPTAEPVQPAGLTPPHPQPSTSTAAGSPIERAKNGTVAIETPWGKGSGFFITDTTIVTNKHVIQVTEEQLQEVRHRVETGRRLIDLEQEKLRRYRQKLERINDGPTRLQLMIVIKEMERQLAEVLPKQQEAESRLRKMEGQTSTSKIRIFFADGTESSAGSTQLSPNRDLALITLYTSKAVVLRPAAKNNALNQGDKVFTIGNPVGLRNTVTAGIFSGYRQHQETGEVLLQTDAAINPGNSGGPLIDEHGRVHGINTMILRNTEGIGFAIPIEEVFKEFSITVPQDR